jgi:hypothetical protein
VNNLYYRYKKEFKMIGRSKIMSLANSKYISGDKSSKLSNAWKVYKTWEIVSKTGNMLYERNGEKAVYLNQKYVGMAEKMGFKIVDKSYIIINKEQMKLYVNFEKFTRMNLK